MKTERGLWKMMPAGMALVSVTALVTGLVANRSGRDEPTAAALAVVARPAPVAQPQPAGVPSQAAS